MSEPFLILHKVRGEPAYDVAEYLGEDNDGPLWIIPTSGHRAWPIESRPLTERWCFETDRFAALPDHYRVSREPKAILTNARDLLARIGLGSQRPDIKRRKIG